MATWVLLRGLMRDRRHWQGFEQRLERKLGAEHTLICPDLAGNGELAHMTSPVAIADYAQAVWQQIDSHTDPSRVILVGLSMGAMLAQDMALRSPSRVSQLILLNSSSANLSPWYQRFYLGSVMSALWYCRKDRDLSFVESSVLMLTSFHRGNDRELAAQWTQYRQMFHTSLLNSLRQLYAAARYHSPAALELPIAVVTGLDDKLVSLKCSQALARHYRCGLFPIKQCGHDIALDQPERLCELLLSIALGTGDKPEAKA